MMSLNKKVKEAGMITNINPTEAQKISGNYKKGKVTINGLRVTIENPVGSYRCGKDDSGKKWKIKMPYSYGYINRTIGKDEEQVDVFLNNDLEHEYEIYIVDQICTTTKAFDEHKVMLGFKDIESAKKAYLKCYQKEWKGLGSITKLSLNKFKSWLTNKQMLKIPANKLNLISKVDMVENNNEDKIHVIRMFGEVLEGKTLNDLKKQAGDIGSFDQLVVEIASPGGSVSEGLLIMTWLEELSQMGKTIVTVVVANAYSIASLIMLAANYRLISKHGKVMVHNPMLPEIKYANANDLEKHIVELRNLESYMYELYGMFTGLSDDAIKKLMDKESYLLPEEAVTNGFADMIVNIEPKEFQMAQTNKKEINMSKTINALNKIVAMVNKSEFVNQLYYDSEGGELEIFQTDPSTIKEGDRTSIKEGVKTLADGAIVTIEDFIITKIDRAITPEEVEAAEDDSTIVPDVEPVVEPVVEPIVEAEAKADEDDAIAKAKVDEDEVVAKAEIEAKAEFKEGEAPEAVVTAKEFEALVNKFGELEAKYSEMKSKMDGDAEVVAKQMENVGKFEETAAKAIDAIYSNTSSGFTPDARAAAVEPSVENGSIFQNMLAKRGL